MGYAHQLVNIFPENGADRWCTERPARFHEDTLARFYLRNSFILEHIIFMRKHKLGDLYILHLLVYPKRYCVDPKRPASPRVLERTLRLLGILSLSLPVCLRNIPSSSIMFL